MPKITLQNSETGETKTIKVGYGANLRQAILYHEGQVYKGMNKFLNCRGLGVCAKCLVEVSPQESGGSRTVFETLHRIPENQRLSCRAKVVGDMVVKSSFKD